MGKNRNRHKTKNKTSNNKSYSNTLGDIMKEQGINLKVLKQKVNEKKTN